MVAEDTIQAELQIVLRDASGLMHSCSDLQSFKRTLHRLEHALAPYCVDYSEDKSIIGTDERDIQNNSCALYLEASTISGLVSILTEVVLPLTFVKINISIEPLYYQVWHKICDTIQKYVQEPLNSHDQDKIIDKVASILLEEDESDHHSNPDKSMLLHKLLQIITSNLASLDGTNTKSYSSSSDPIQDIDTVDSPLSLTITETVELTRILMQSSIRWTFEAGIPSDEYKNEHDFENLIIQLHIFLGFIFQHLLSFNIPFYDILLSQYTTTELAHEKARTDSLIRKYLSLVELYLKETIEHAVNSNYHSIQSIHYETFRMNSGSSQVNIDQTMSFFNSCIRNTSLALGMIEIIHMTLRVTRPKLDDLVASLWLSFGELLAFTCPSEMLGGISALFDTADDLLFRLHQVVSDDELHVSTSFRKIHEKTIRCVAFTTISRLLHSLDTRNSDDHEREEWIQLLLNHFQAPIFANPHDHESKVSSWFDEMILFFSLNHLITHEGKYSTYILEKRIQLNPTDERGGQSGEDSCYSTSLLLNPWYAIFKKKCTDHVIPLCQSNPHTTSVSSSVSDLSSLPKKRQRLSDNMATTTGNMYA